MKERSDVDPAFQALWWRSTRGVDRPFPEDELPKSYWIARVAQLGLSSVLRDEWSTDLCDPDVTLSRAGGILFRTAERGRARGERAVLEIGSAVVLASRDARGQLRAVAAAKTDDEANDAITHLHTTFPKQLQDGHRVEMRFWSYDHGASSRDQTLDVCTWAEICGNYGSRTRADLEALMGAADMSGPGKLVLWLGPPGTGKTYALRALAWEQRERLIIHYILDPEVFLNRSDYIMELFGFEDDFVGEDDYGDDPRSGSLPRARLIVLEDAGELLGADAMSHAGQGLSRLLNLTDGLPGQASHTRVLITTNEDVGRLHPAVIRPGRCASLVRFAPLDEAEVGRWLRDQGRECDSVETRSSNTIADLFALARGDAALPMTRPSLGFDRPR